MPIQLVPKHKPKKFLTFAVRRQNASRTLTNDVATSRRLVMLVLFFVLVSGNFIFLRRLDHAMALFENLLETYQSTDGSDVSWTLNMFEMDHDKHKLICLTGGTGTQPNHTWPSYINHPDPPPDPAIRDNVKIKFLALYFPQFYRDPLNKNISDWDYFQNLNFTHNVNKVRMHGPLNSIYYDPRCLEHRRTQAALAKKYLLDGFIYYFYFPDDTWILSGVHKQLLLDGEPSTDFAFYWVNEEFAGRNSVYQQAELLANVLLPFVSHPRYITIDGRPILYIYAGTQVPSDYMQTLQDTLMKNGVPKLYIVTSIMWFLDQTVKVDFADAYAEFPPNIGDDLAMSYGYRKWAHAPDYHLGMSINFDNTPRMSEGDPNRLPKRLSKGRPCPREQPTPEEFEQRCISRVRAWYKNTKKEKVVTFFAWNEWSEQAALEPSDLYGYGYLEAFRACRLNVTDLEVPASDSNSTFR